MMKLSLDIVFCADIVEWNSWLQDHHATSEGIWLKFKRGSGAHGLDYEEAVREALCWGWIDSLIKNIDAEWYMRKFTPRKETSKWSQSNKRRVECLIQEGRMKPEGMWLVETAKKTGRWGRDDRPIIPMEVPVALQQAFRVNPEAGEFFYALSRSDQKPFIAWIVMAKRPETRKRHVEESIRVLLRKEKLGLK